MNYGRALAATVAAVSVFMSAAPARSELVLSQIIVELHPGKSARQDIEIWNNGPDVTYVAIEPREILGAGTSRESGRTDQDPEKLGLLVSPARIVLEPGQRKLMRVAALDGSLDRERVYRVTVRPVVGELSSDQSGLKILVGYDLLVLVRPANPRSQVSGTRSGKLLTLRNDGNTSVELTEGKQCDASGRFCEPLPGGRVYAGAEKTISIDPSRRAHYVLRLPGALIPKDF